MAAHKVKQAGAPLTIDAGSDASRYVFEELLDRTLDEPVPADSRVQVKQSYGGKALKVALRGPYRRIPETREKIAAYLAVMASSKTGIRRTSSPTIRPP